ncbi:hypothetical protein L1987_30424 [Smallanthus sonchifolius]|uniref:Uncharacterized protein n=1 Tax=Smallanthus sonchifolius TaxID=185202 RepID=A0ACB9I2T2_9ASTR|nr:hypothetical protein L1987_30424 [Smallanthus sonchifolius]
MEYGPHGIKGFPTIELFVPGKPPVDDQVAREAMPIGEFALQQVIFLKLKLNIHYPVFFCYSFVTFINAILVGAGCLALGFFVGAQKPSLKFLSTKTVKTVALVDGNKKARATKPPLDIEKLAEIIEEFKVLVVRNDLKMGKGKIDVQCRGKHHLFKQGYKNAIDEAIRLSHLAIETSDHGTLKETHRLDYGASHYAKSQDTTDEIVIPVQFRFQRLWSDYFQEHKVKMPMVLLYQKVLIMHHKIPRWLSITLLIASY